MSYFFKQNIAIEAKLWVDSELISEEQAHFICQKYNIDYAEDDQKSFGYFVLLALAYLFMGLALILLISENWEELPRLLRMGGLIALLILIYGLALRKIEHTNTILLVFLANIVYGASIILIAQMYHLGEHMPDGIFWWALGILPFPFLLRSNFLMLLPLILGTLWFTLEYDTGIYKESFIILLLLSFYALNKFKINVFSFIITLLITILWVVVSLDYYLDLHYEERWSIVLSMTFFAYAISNAIKNTKFKPYASSLKWWSLHFLLFALFLLTFDVVLNDIKWHFFRLEIYLFSFILFALSYFIYRSKTFIAILFAFNLMLVILSFDFINPIVVQVFFNVLFLISAIALILKGIERSESHFFFLGVVSILFLAFARYITLVGNYIGASLLFMGLSAILIFSAKYWQKQGDKDL
jgi:uncharacterized membrane protein